MSKKNTKDVCPIIDKLIAFSEELERWPVVVDLGGDSMPSERQCRKVYGSWTEAKTIARDEYIKRNGFPVWAVDGPQKKLTPTIRNRNAVAEMVESTIHKVSAFPRNKSLTPKRDKKKDLAEFHCVISDVHVGEMTEKRLASGFSHGYDTPTFRKAADTHEEKLMRFTDIYRSGFNIDKLVVNFLGDIVTGELIFQGQGLQIDSIITEQVFEAANRFSSMFANWADNFKEVEIYCMHGNHGRIGRKDEAHQLSNLDRIAYYFVRERLRDYKNITMHIADSPNMIVQHGDRNFLLQHGDHVKGISGTNYMSAKRKMQAVAAMADIPIHYSVMGHVHTAGGISVPQGGKIFVNGSYPGGTGYSVDVCSDTQIPSQKGWLFSPSRGYVHSEVDFVLGDRVVLEQDENRIYTPYS